MIRILSQFEPYFLDTESARVARSDRLRNNHEISASASDGIMSDNIGKTKPPPSLLRAGLQGRRAHASVSCAPPLAFKDDSLARAIIKFKQGFGRLIRSSTERGRVVIRNARIVSKGYGKRFLSALPPGMEPKVLNRSQMKLSRCRIGNGLHFVTPSCPCRKLRIFRDFFHFSNFFSRSIKETRASVAHARRDSRDGSSGQHSTWLKLIPVRPAWVIATAIPHVYFSFP